MMLGLGSYLKLCLQRRYCLLSVISLGVALLTFVLKHNYVGKQRDLIYWLELLRASTRLPLFTSSLVMVTLLQLVLLGMVQTRFNQVMKLVLSDLSHRYCMRKFADFIVRRMLYHLELAMSKLPAELDEQALLDDELLQKRYQLARDEAYQAVEVFRRDASALLFARHRLPQEVAPFFVLKEEEMLLQQAGYAQIGLKVTHQVLWQLLYPESGSVT